MPSLWPMRLCISSKWSSHFCPPLWTNLRTSSSIHSSSRMLSTAVCLSVSPLCLIVPWNLFTEIRAVDSEFTLSLQDDGSRRDQIMGDLAGLPPLAPSSFTNPPSSERAKFHPLCKFGCGNYHTLSELPKQQGILVHERLEQFHTNYYSSNLMTLVIRGMYCIVLFRQLFIVSL